MYTIILFFIPIIIIEFLVIRELVRGNLTQWVDNIMGWLVPAVIAGLMFTGIITSIFGETKKVEHRTSIVSLADNNQTEGSFCLGSGTIEGVFYYCYYYNHINGGYALGKVRSSEARIVEWNKNYAQKVWYTDESTSDKWLCGGSRNGDYVFYVPKRTVVRNYRLDAQ